MLKYQYILDGGGHMAHNLYMLFKVGGFTADWIKRCFEFYDNLESLQFFNPHPTIPGHAVISLPVNLVEEYQFLPEKDLSSGQFQTLFNCMARQRDLQEAYVKPHKDSGGKVVSILFGIQA